VSGPEDFRLVVISGVSGSGKSHALKTFEDCGFFSVDNLPAPLFLDFINFLEGVIKDSPPASQYRRVALLVDCREPEVFPPVKHAVARLGAAGVNVSLLYFDCDDDVVIQRFKTTRRPHPLLLESGTTSSLREAILEERRLLEGFQAAAERTIDTSSYTPHDLRKVIEAYVAEGVGELPDLEISLLSFGYKYGVPAEADLMFDVRFLPNPHFVSELRLLTGLDASVSEFVFDGDAATDFVAQLQSFLNYLVPRYREEGKSYLTIAIGCTGGRHRSVALVEQIKSKLSDASTRIHVYHRDIERSS